MTLRATKNAQARPAARATVLAKSAKNFESAKAVSAGMVKLLKAARAVESEGRGQEAILAPGNTVPRGDSRLTCWLKQSGCVAPLTDMTRARSRLTCLFK